MAGGIELINGALGALLGPTNTIGTIGGLAGGAMSALDMLINPKKNKIERYRDPEVTKTLGMYDKNAEAILANSPEAARQASAQTLQQGMSDAQGGALNSATSQQLATGAGSGDASMGAAVGGARSMAASLGATSPFLQALSQGHQTALQQTQQNQMNYTANTQGREQAAEAYDTFIHPKDPSLAEALAVGGSVGSMTGSVLNGLGLGDKTQNVNLNQNRQVDENMEVYTDPITGQRKYRQRNPNMLQGVH